MKYTESQINKISKDLQNKIKGKVLFDPFSRGRYSTDSSLYQITPWAQFYLKIKMMF